MITLIIFSVGILGFYNYKMDIKKTEIAAAEKQKQIAQRAIEKEKRSKYQFEWTRGSWSSKFSKFRWKSKPRLTLTYYGDDIKFQNIFGAWENMIYQCDYDPVNKKVLAVQVYPGRL